MILKNYLKPAMAFFMLLLLSNYILAQTKASLSGTITDEQTGETLIGATVKITELPKVGTTTNSYGFYSLTLPVGTYTVNVSFVGYKTVSQKVELSSNQKLNIQVGNGENLKEVVITERKADENITQTQMGVEKLDVKSINNIPVLFGEKDILKTIQLLPGIKSAGEGQSGFFVRGGSADQNLILLDEAVVYNASHLLGFFSVFNCDAIIDVTIYKGSMPANYGGRLSSVLDIKMNEGNNQKFHVSGGLGLIASKLNVEGPLKKNKGSFLLTGRRTYADLFLKLSSDEQIRNNKLYFYDFNAKANYTLNDNNRVYLSGYFGRDVLGFGSNFGFNWGNTTATARLNHVFNPKLFSNTSLIYSNYDYKINISSNTFTLGFGARIEDIGIKEELQYFPSPRHSFKFGINATKHKLTPNIVTATGAVGVNADAGTPNHSLENVAYATGEYKATEFLSFAYGLRGNDFLVLGPGNFKTYNADGSVNSSRDYKSNEPVINYFNLEPRLSANYILNSKSSIKAGYARNTQNFHLLTNATTSNPTDQYIVNSKNVKPELSDLVSIGYFRNFRNNMFEFSTETYYKTLKNQIDYKNNANLQGNNNVEADLLYGQGRAYGIEFLLKKVQGKFTGWLGYTLSRTERKFDGINKGNYYPARQDRTHDLSVVGIYQASKRWTLSATFVYSTGNAVTFPSGKYSVDGNVALYYTERNGYRFPAYHRMDVGATFITKKTEKFESSLNFSVYNVYARENAYTITFQQSETDPNRTEALRTALFKIVPSISYNFKF